MMLRRSTVCRPWIAATLLLACIPYPAQPQAVSNANGWYMYFGDHPVAERWTLHLEGQWRRSDVITRWQQLLLRPAATYRLHERLTVSAGYAYVRSYPYGEAPGEPSREHRIYQEADLRHPLTRARLSHRVRLEQRFIAPTEEVNPDWEHRNRLRYRLQGRVPLRARSLDESRLYVSLYNEVFTAFGAHRGPRVLDQNRTYGALGINLGPESRLEVGYLFQYVPQRSGLVEHNHTLQLSFFSEASLW